MTKTISYTDAEFVKPQVQHVVDKLLNNLENKKVLESYSLNDDLLVLNIQDETSDNTILKIGIGIGLAFASGIYNNIYDSK